MASLLNGDGDGPLQRFGTRLSESFLNARGPKPTADPDYDPKQIIPVAERKAAMSGLDPTEAKWARAAYLLATLTAVLVAVLVATQHVTKKVGAHKVDTTTGNTTEAILIGGIVLLFAVLGMVALGRNRRTLVVFSLFIIGFATTLTIAPLGFAFILFGGWLMLRAYRVQKYGTPNAKLAATQAAARPPRRARKAAATAAASPRPTGHKPPSANKRYTPKQPARKKVPKPVE
jgi:hypothetical protein